MSEKRAVKPMPLERYRVLDWTQWQQGPVAGAMLADLGADVIKIEDPVQGDGARGFVPAMKPGSSWRNAYFEGCNRNKRGITLNLKTEKGREIFYRLVEKSDVFLHNFRDAIVSRLGLEYETLKKYNPKLVYVQVSGFGPEGPEKDFGAFDSLGIARSGLMMSSAEVGMPPQPVSGAISDQIGAIMTAYGALAGLLAREQLGIGQKVETSMLGSMMWLQATMLQNVLIGGMDVRRGPRTEASSPVWNYYQCSDEKWVFLAHMQPQRQWSNVCRALGITELENDPRFATIESRRQNCVELIAIMDKIFATKTQEEWLKILHDHDVVCCQINSYEDLPNDRQVIANQYLIDFEHPRWGKMPMVGVPVRLGETPGRLWRPAPEHGQHTEEVLMELLGYSWEEMGKLREQGVV